jgi:hypothetical protein
MGKVKKSSYKKKWGGEGEGGEVPAAPAVVANAEPAPNPTKPSIFGNPLAAVTDLGTNIKDKVTTGLTSIEEGAKNLNAKGEGAFDAAKEKVSGNVAALKDKFEAVTKAVTGPTAAPAGQDPKGGGKRRRTRKRTAKRKSHKRKRTHKRKKSHKRRK